MIEKISTWAGGIVTAVIIVTIIEMILPDNNTKKYIKTVLGVYILFTILSPIVKNVLGKEISFETLNIADNVLVSGSTYNTEYKTNENIEKIYKENLKKDIQEKLKQKGYNASNIIIKFSQNNYNDINEISLNLNIIENIKEIEKININITKQEEAINEKVIDKKDRDEIKQFLILTYGAKNILIK